MQKDVQQFRDKEFECVFFDVLKESESVKEAYQKAVKHKASCFFASPRYAMRYVILKERGLQIKITNPTTIRMYEEIYARYLLRREIYPCKTKKEIIEDIINSPAPCFYVSISRAKHIIRRLRNDQRRNRQRERKAQK